MPIQEVTENAQTKFTANSGTCESTVTQPAYRQVTVSAYDIRERSRTDLDFFASVLMPSVATASFPTFYKALWQLFTKLEMDASKVFRFVLGLPRGHAKTTFIKLLICWLVLYNRAHFILMVCSTEPHSYNMMDDVDSMLSGRVVRDVWGNWKSGLVRDTKGLKRGKFNGQDVVLAALGAGTSVRGLNIINNRPDVIVMDDIQTKECAQSEAENKALLAWLVGTLIKCRNMHRCLLVYIGNMYNDECILNYLKMHPQWQSFIVGAILADWTPLWPEVFTLEQLLDEYKHDNQLGLGEVWFSEVMNIAIGGRLSLLPEGRIPLSPIIATESPIGSFIIIDPSGYRKHSDDTCIAVHCIYAPMHYRVEAIEAAVMNPGECINNTIRLAQEYNCTHIFVEGVAYQQTLKWHMEEAIKEFPQLSYLTVHEVSPSRRAKTSRIRAWVKTLLEGSYSLSPNVRDAVLFQALAFRIERTDNTDDILDCNTYGLDVRADYQDVILDSFNRLEYLTRYTDANRPRVVDNNSFLDI